MPFPDPISSLGIVKRPPQNHHDKISPWLDEHIWGHRLYAQTPWLIFLEFLTVVDAANRTGNLFIENDEFYPLKFRPKKRLYLRNILWNNEPLKIIQETIGDNEKAWDQWIESMTENAKGAHSFDFKYLRNRFRSFNNFADLVIMLQRDANVEAETNRRWSSRFVFPFGSNALYEDLNIQNHQHSREYINFGRTGELLYMMICRSKFADELRPFFLNFLEGNNKWNKLLGKLQPDEESIDDSERGYSYLPYKEHPTFAALGQDWLNIFQLHLPGFDAFEYLTVLGSLHLLLYQMRISQTWIGDEAKTLRFVCEVVTPKRTVIRQLSIFNYQENNALSTRAVEAYINTVDNSNDWRAAMSDLHSTEEKFVKGREVLQKQFWWGEDSDLTIARDPDLLLKELRETAIKGHQQGVADLHRFYGRKIGLISKRGTNKYRYAPSDLLLKTLLFANVKKRMELHEFLKLLYERYSFVFGPNEAERALPAEDFDKQLFKANANRLEQRLTSLGLLKRLSDGCAYVINPFSL